MGLADFMRVVRRRWWIIVALMLIGAGVAWVTTPSEDTADGARYRASTVVVRGLSTTNASGSGVNLDLAASSARSGEVIDRSAAELGLAAIDLLDGLTVTVDPRSSTLEISSVDATAEGATLEANTIASNLITFVAERSQQQLEPLIDATQANIDNLQTTIDDLQGEIASPFLPERPEAQGELEAARRQQIASRDRLEQLNSQSADAINQLTVFAPATAALDTEDSSFSVPESEEGRALIGAAVGLVAALVLIAGVERLNPKIRTITQAEQAYGLPVIAEIVRRPKWRRSNGIVSFTMPHSAEAECYRNLRTALVFIPRSHENDSERQRPFENGHVVLVTSAAPNEGKTTVAANLAAGFAEKDGDVVVISADPRRPTIEDLLLKKRPSNKFDFLDRHDAVLTTVPGVRLVRSCDPDGNPADIVDFEHDVARDSRARSQIVVIDTPPALVANDAMELMHSADSTVLVARCGVTTVASAHRVAELIARQGVNVVGVVLVGADNATMSSSGYYRRTQRRQAKRTDTTRGGRHSRSRDDAPVARGRRVVDITEQPRQASQRSVAPPPPAPPVPPAPSPRMNGNGQGNGHNGAYPSPRDSEQAGAWPPE